MPIMLTAALSALAAEFVGEKIVEAIAQKVFKVDPEVGLTRLQVGQTTEPGKGVIQSKTMWGVAIATVGPVAVGKAAAWLGLSLGELQQLVEAGTVIVGVVLAWYGRKSAKQPMGMQGRVV